MQVQNFLGAVPMRSVNTMKTIRGLRILMSFHGIVDFIVTQNGSVFTSHEFEVFVKLN